MTRSTVVGIDGSASANRAVDWAVDTLVLGGRGLGRFGGFVLGSSGMALAGHAHSPVVIVREPYSGSHGEVVAGFDGSPDAEAAPFDRGGGRSEPAAVDRASLGDVLNLAVDVGPVPMQAGACLVLEAGPGFDLDRARHLVSERVRAVPRLRQRLVPVPLGCGRPVWVDDPAFDLGHHLHVRTCPSPGDERALLDLAAEIISRRLAPARPLWSITIVTGLAGDRVGLIACFHHVLADGIGGLAVLGALVDGTSEPAEGGAQPATGQPETLLRRFPCPAPPLRRIAAEAWVSRLRALARLPHAGAVIRRAAAELGAPSRVARCSLNQPTGPHQSLATVTVRLDDVLGFAHAHGGTVNDAVLAAITGALRALLAGRGESVPELVASVPVSARTSATSDWLGNQVGVMPVRLPTAGTLSERLERTAAITRARKSTFRKRQGSAASWGSAELLAGMNRVLARVGALGWFMDHQRLIHTAVTNLRGPEQPLAFNGATVAAVIPISLARGNVSVAFSVLSYAGALTISVAADTDRTPDLPLLITALRGELAAMR
ncbi:wax ester/triacylglycerol synthase domain-containing protein [Nonomuraea guangzhouensis]|uniref:diacylglycerol O-acyltransferase n=1 Tax=Nonomuraea guangzhouensis TaxID=1291555 RepID=A0ABW4GZU1_9ACTN|nr:wax ester/triacylglycerol synthase domain-containing protein [Nonomuraea guangzhouensis]